MGGLPRSAAVAIVAAPEAAVALLTVPNPADSFPRGRGGGGGGKF